jgi:hypothetical protein
MCLYDERNVVPFVDAIRNRLESRDMVCLSFSSETFSFFIHPMFLEHIKQHTSHRSAIELIFLFCES